MTSKATSPLWHLWRQSATPVTATRLSVMQSRWRRPVLCDICGDRLPHWWRQLVPPATPGAWSPPTRSQTTLYGENAISLNKIAIEGSRWGHIKDATRRVYKCLVMHGCLFLLILRISILTLQTFTKILFSTPCFSLSNALTGVHLHAYWHWSILITLPGFPEKYSFSNGDVLF